MDCATVEQSELNRTLDEKQPLANGEIEDDGPNRRDQIVKRKANERSLDATLERRWTKCSAGYVLQETNWTNAGPQPRSETRRADVESSSDQPAPENWLEVHQCIPVCQNVNGADY